MISLKNCIATSVDMSRWFVLLLCLVSGLANAAAGTVVNLSGALLAIAPNGERRVLSVGSEVNPGDTLVTPEKTYARLKFTDQGELVLRPNTQVKLEGYSFNEAKPAEDNLVLSLAKGALRSLTGMISKRGNRDAYALKTATATIGIRGTQFITEYVPSIEQDLAEWGAQRGLAMWQSRSEPLAMSVGVTDVPIGVLPAVAEPLQLAQAGVLVPTSGLSPGLYVQVLDGLIQVSNSGGSQQFSPGQFGFTPSFMQPPVILPKNPGMLFSPPPSFNTSTTGNQSAKGESNAVDCEVR